MLSSITTSLHRFNRVPSVYASISGFIVLVAFYVPGCWFVAFIALVPLFHALWRAQSARHAFALGSLTGAIIAGGTSLYYFAVLPLAEHVSVFANFTLVFLSWFSAIVVVAPMTGLFALAFRLTPRRGVGSFIIVPLIWVAFEWLRMLAFSIVTFAPEVANPPFYSAGFLGYPLADTSSWLQLAALGGIYAMSAAAAAANYAFFRFLTLSRARATSLTVVLVAVLALISLTPIAALRARLDAPSTSVFRVGVVSVHMPEFERVSRYKEGTRYQNDIAARIERLAAAGAEVILLPEGSRFLNPEKRTVGTSSPIIIDSSIMPVSGVREAIAYQGGTDGSVTQAVRAKRLLTPQGEYVISLFRLGAALIGKGAEAKTFAQTKLITPGSWGDAVTISGSHRASILFCVEILAPGFGAALVREQESDVLLVLLSHGGFRPSYLFAVDTRRFLAVRAVEAGVPLVASADNAAAYVMDRYGHIEVMLGASWTSADAVVTVALP